MQLTLSQKDLTLTGKALNKTLSRKPHLPVLAGIFLKASSSDLELTSTDLVAGIKVKLPAIVSQPGETIVNGKTFLETIAFFDQEETTFELKEKELLLINGKDKVSIPLLGQDFPDFSPLTTNSQKTTADFWEQAVKKVGFAASSDQTRPALTALLLRGAGNCLQTVCTDGFRLAVLDQTLTTDFFHQKSLLFSAKAIADLTSLLQIFSQTETSLVYDEVGNQVFFLNDQFSYFTKLINSNYPPFEKIIPLEFATQIEVDRQDLIKNLNKSAVFSRSSNNIVKLEIKKDSLHFLASSLGEGTFESEQELISFQGEALKIAFNIRYLLDFLSLCTDDTIKIGFNGHDHPALLKTAAEAGWQYVVMPFKPKG